MAGANSGWSFVVPKVEEEVIEPQGDEDNVVAVDAYDSCPAGVDHMDILDSDTLRLARRGIGESDDFDV